MTNLVSTYRFQFHKEFNFNDFERILPYLQKLGVGTIYASPIFASVPGSTHGYDGLNPLEVNPEIGTREQLYAIGRKLSAHSINWLQDIVPNHMAFDPQNEWMMDVLEKGQQSKYAGFFDSAFSDSLFEGRIMVPFLGNTLEEVIEKNELAISYYGDRFVFKYYDAAYPLQPFSYESILKIIKEKTPVAIKQLIGQVPRQEDKKEYGEAWDEFRIQLAGLFSNEKTRLFINKCIEKINADKDLLRKIESEQFYRLCHWKETDNAINYRRFFTVNGLICLNIQDENVFKTYHGLVKQLLEEGIVNGLRIDHIDGLYDPTQYLERLRSLAGEDVPIVVEKILEPGEKLPGYWPVQGTTGYEFLSLVNNLFTNRASQKAFNKFYQVLSSEQRAVSEQVIEKKSRILHEHMAGELENLFRLFMQSEIIEKKSMSSVRPEEIKEVIGEFLIHCPVYRYYGTGFPLQGEEHEGVHRVMQEVRKYNPELNAAIDLFENALLTGHGSEELNEKMLVFYQRCLQFTGPLMAKGVEDTLMYTYNRFIGHNEVGDAPDAFGIGIDEFHEAMKERQINWPLSLNATSTHDTKRGEDVRARLNVLTDLGELWLETVKEWELKNEDLKTNGHPVANDEYFIYQSIVGAHPFPGEDEDDFTNRIKEYIQKSLREAKAHSNWTSPNTDYENAAKEFATALLDSSRPFRNDLDAFLKNIADHGIINSISQTILKFTCPGIPDVYQGCELWDLSLVDPDNRRPVDFDKRMEWLESLQDEINLDLLWNERHDGKIKLWITSLLLNLRRQQPYLFTSGEYHPLKVDGKYKDHIIAFTRKYRHNIIVVVLPLHTAIICKEQSVEALDIDWEDTRVNMPEDTLPDWSHLTGNVIAIKANQVNVSEIFRLLPFGILEGQRLANERGAGILLHISSLPTSFGIGDMGPAAKSFADFLQRTGQKYWQLLPLNPTEEGQGHSPYSSISSRAGNVLFISPELLVKDGLLDASDLHDHHIVNNGHTNFREAERIKSLVFDKAWNQYQGDDSHPLQKGFQAFEEKEKEWLHDFAIYVLLKQEHGGKPWYEWPGEYKFRDKQSLQKLVEANEAHIQKIKWLQFIFSKQWHDLKSYCNRSGIQFIGDLPFYVSYDSADVWSHRQLFALDEHGNRTGMAGVPPDAFSADGQLWGMPVFKWEEHKNENYKWWIERLKKNIELFDLVRLDHFRAFSAYWEVPAGETTAKNGEWKPGPGSNFFTAIQNELGKLPFVAEDLGEIDEPVYQLRDAFHLPGMKVLQFAFGAGMDRSVHIPHNYKENFFVYTGTHDNNTLRGWFTSDANEETRLALERYIGRPVSAAEVHIILSRMAFASVARVVILPIQDLLNLNENARMNTPASVENNWTWRLLPGQVDKIAESNLKNWTRMFNRET